MQGAMVYISRADQIDPNEYGMNRVWGRIQFGMQIIDPRNLSYCLRLFTGNGVAASHDADPFARLDAWGLPPAGYPAMVVDQVDDHIVVEVALVDMFDMSRALNRRYQVQVTSACYKYCDNVP